DDRVRKVTRFRIHNLLDPMPDAPFDLIFCRNVLVYFSPAAAKKAVRHLAAALAPGGALLFGAMDIGEPPPDLIAAGPPEMQIFRRPEEKAAPQKARQRVEHPAPALPHRPALPLP